MWLDSNVCFRTFTPVPKRIQDGTEDITPAAVTSGAPMELQARSVR
jgi:NADH dehydrogenase (ubiquinone) Fe-S protein 4